MKNLLIIILVLFITNCFACKLDYTAQTDSTICLQEMVNNNILITLNDGVILITKNIILHSNINIIGHNTVIKFKTSLAEQAVFRGDNINNITITNITIKDDGVFRDVLFQYPYDNNQFAIGFTNLDRGIMILGNSSNIILDKLDISGVEMGIIIDNKRLDKLNYINKLSISNSNITNIGKFGIALFNCQNVNLKNNTIDNVQGNMTYGIAPVLSDTKFGDGFYLNGIINGNIVNNNINNVIRIGIVLEGRLNNNSDVTNLNDNVSITNNIITDFYGSRGTEYNAGIWAEPATDVNHQRQFKTDNVVMDNNYTVNGAYDKSTDEDCEIIVVNKLWNSDNDVNTFAHDSFHAAVDILEACHIKLSDDTNEVFAYLIGYFTECVNKTASKV